RPPARPPRLLGPAYRRAAPARTTRQPACAGARRPRRARPLRCPRQVPQPAGGAQPAPWLDRRRRVGGGFRDAGRLGMAAAVALSPARANGAVHRSTSTCADGFGQKYARQNPRKRRPVQRAPFQERHPMAAITAFRAALLLAVAFVAVP